MKPEMLGSSNESDLLIVRFFKLLELLRPDCLLSKLTVFVFSSSFCWVAVIGITSILAGAIFYGAIALPLIGLALSLGFFLRRLSSRFCKAYEPPNTLTKVSLNLWQHVTHFWRLQHYASFSQSGASSLSRVFYRSRVIDLISRSLILALILSMSLSWLLNSKAVKRASKIVLPTMNKLRK